MTRSDHRIIKLTCVDEEAALEALREINRLKDEPNQMTVFEIIPADRDPFTVHARTMIPGVDYIFSVPKEDLDEEIYKYKKSWKRFMPYFLLRWFP